MEMRDTKDIGDHDDEGEGMTVSQLHDVSVHGEFDELDKNNESALPTIRTTGSEGLPREVTDPESEIYDPQTVCGNSGISQEMQDAGIDEIDTDPKLRTPNDTLTAVNVEKETNKLRLDTDHSSLVADHSCDGLMTVSQLYEAGNGQASLRHSNTDRNSVNFDGMTISQLYNATNVLGDTLNETAEKCASKDSVNEDAVSTQSNGCHGDNLHSNGDHGDSACLATGGCHDEEERTYVTKQPEGMCVPNVSSVDTREIHKHDGSTAESLTTICGSVETHSEAGGESQDAADFFCTLNSSGLGSETQVDLSGHLRSPSNTNMLCISTNPSLSLLRTRSDCVDTFNIIGKENESHHFTEGLSTDKSINIIHNQRDHNDAYCSQSVIESSESQGIGITDTYSANTAKTPQEYSEEFTQPTYPHDLVSGEFNSTEISEKGATRNQEAVIDVKVPWNGISGTCAISDLPKDFNCVGFGTLSRSKNGDHAKFLRMYNQIDLDDKTENVNPENDTNYTNFSERNKDTSDTVSEGYGTIKRNGSISSTVRLRRQKSSPDPGRKGFNGSPLMRVRGIITDDASSYDSDSPRCSEDSEDEDDDAGIYADSYRMSRWLYLGESDLSFLSDVGNLTISRSGSSSPSMAGTTSSGTCDSISDLLDEGHDLSSLESQEGLRDLTGSQEIPTQGEPQKKNHRRSESISTTASEVEFRLKYKTKTRRVVQRKSSMQLYQRISEKYLDEGRIVTIEKLDEDASFGFHIKDNQPVIVSTVEEGSPAQRGGLQVGDVLIAVNEVNVLEASHQEVVKLMAADTDRVKLRVAADRLPADAPLCCGYLTKQGGSGILKNWRRRWFVLKQDHCLYYYKNEEDTDPLGAILLSNYTITKAPEINRKFVFKASKYGQRTYYFQADAEEDMTGWASAMASAADVSNKQDTWLDVSSHNVGLPALSIKQPDCHGHLTKMGHRHKTWKRRYCVLKDACLYYYMDVSSSTAQGVAHLHGYTVEDNLPFNKKFGFMVVPPDKTLRTFYFSADNETDKKRWMEALQKSISRWVRADEA